VHVISCDSVVQFLNSNPSGIAYARQRDGTNQALQDFIITGQSGDAQRVIFLISFIAALFGCINGAREIVKEAAIYRRERLVNLGILPYMFSKIVVLGALALLQAASMVFIVHLFEPFHQGVFLPVFLEVYITLALTAVAGVILGLAVSAIATNEDIANTLLPVILIPQVIFAGSIIPLKDWVSTIVAVIFPIRWAMAALGSTIGLHSDKISGDKLFGNDYTYHGTLYSIYSQSDASQRILLSWLALALIIIVLTIIIAIFLKRKDIRR
jgi:ABC-type multidrug transport system permease subunit